jgi:restriction endonuclease Mrr
MNEKEWLQNLKAGDPVYISTSGWGQNYRNATVERVGKIHITVDGQKYRRDTGRRAGPSRYSVFLSQPSQAIEDAIGLQKLRMEVQGLVNCLKVPKDRVTLEKMRDALVPTIEEELEG